MERQAGAGLGQALRAAQGLGLSLRSPCKVLNRGARSLKQA